MLTVTGMARTVEVIGEGLVKRKRTGANGEYEDSHIMMRVAVRRENSGRTVVENGVSRKEYITDYVVVSANGGLADALNKCCNLRDADGKLISRHLFIRGSLNTYQKEAEFTEKQTVLVPIQGADPVPMQFDAKIKKKISNSIIALDQFILVDANPMNNTERPVVQAGGVPVQANIQTATPVGTGAPVGATATAAPSAPSAPIMTPEVMQQLMTMLMGGAAPAAPAAPAQATATAQPATKDGFPMPMPQGLPLAANFTPAGDASAY